MDTSIIHLWLAEDDSDDCFLFQEALTDISTPIQLTMVNNGEQLMELLIQKHTRLPNLLCMDLNMLRKNGHECLVEIKEHPILKTLPVIILSTRSHPNGLDRLYQNGAHHYVQKPDSLPQLVNIIKHLLEMLKEKNWRQPAKDNFVLCVF